MIKETEIKTNEQTNKQTDKQLDKKPNTNVIETNRNIYSDEDRHACKKNVQTMSKAGKKIFLMFINCFYTSYALLRDASFLIGSL